MDLDFDFEKELDFCLEKADMEDFMARVFFGMDCSGSMRSEYENGNMDLLNRILLQVALKFDDNQEMEIIGFDSSATKLKNMTEFNYKNYVNDVLLKTDLWGGTRFRPVMDIINKECFYEDKNNSFFGKFFSKSKTLKDFPIKKRSLL